MDKHLCSVYDICVELIILLGNKGMYTDFFEKCKRKRQILYQKPVHNYVFNFTLYSKVNDIIVFSIKQCVLAKEMDW